MERMEQEDLGDTCRVFVEKTERRTREDEEE
jgi:hypothetical protein